MIANSRIRAGRQKNGWVSRSGLLCILLQIIFIGPAAWSAAGEPTGEDFDRLGVAQTWLNQLQYRRTLWGNWKSEAEGESFFISPNGKHSPSDELKATFELFVRAPETPWGFISQPVVCAFPTRRKFLEENLKVQFKNVDCSDYLEWKRDIQKKYFYLIFSDAFPNNPASMFGHTFVLISDSERPEAAEGLLDYAINFSADTSGTNERSLFYTLRGLFGGYKGVYRIYPFYQMINQYSNWDSRDLWYLRLAWNDQQIERFLDHVWEIFTTTYFDYYFFDENCSYRLLAALDYADPGLNLIDEFYSRLPIYYVAPISTFKAVGMKSSLDRSAQLYTPSIQKRMRAQLSSLSPKEKQRFHEIRSQIDLLDHETNPKVLDMLVSHFDYQKRIASSNYLPEQILTNLAKSLKRRSQLKEASMPLTEIARPSSPFESHRLLSFFAGGHFQEGQTSLALGGKLGYHDLLSSSSGFERWSHLNVFETQFRLGSGQIKFDSLTVLNLISFFPLELHESRISWRAEAGWDLDYYGYARTGIGASWQTSDKLKLFYLFLNPVLLNNSELSDHHGYLFEGEFGFAQEVSERFKFWLTIRQHHKGRMEKLQAAYLFDRDNEFRIVLKEQLGSPQVLTQWCRNF